MIISTVDPDDYWSCLIRRGMLHSETESVEHFTLAPGQELHLGTQGVHEAAIILSGTTSYQDQDLTAGAVLLAPAGEQATLTAVAATTILNIRAYPEPVTTLLPARVPELPEAERVI
ncbi:hypothetical protein BIU82_13835 [Arthrobacter sp. SW1]|uniref:hypothetical protein n=1 Tax=Arthrobacter sp. SW1 TaxID=1920889 RepID=UPI000877B21E|nr:hypothetical protein [Arthrobacter sp. SW1]OFI39408.1 hypothetical protein BIU82_13835 [Arthrobacter sp. SW1]